jgi:outer membrane protein TolC
MTARPPGTPRLRPLVGATLLALTALAGCGVNEEAEVARYRGILDAGTADVAFAPGDPLPLDTTLLLANRHNERLAIGGEDYLQALIDKDRAAAAFLPTVSLIPSYSYADSGDDRRNSRSGEDIGDPGDPDDVFGGGGGGSRSTSTGDGNFDVPANLRMNLFNGFRDVAGVRAAGSEIERREALLRDLQAVVLLDVAQTYYQVLRSEQSVRVLRNSARLQGERVRDMRARNQAGLARPLDVAQSEAQASATRATLISAEADVRNGRTVLSFLTGHDVSGSPLLDGMSVPAEARALEDYLADAESGRQDLAAARAATGVAQQGVRQAVGQYYPSVTLNFNAYLDRQSDPVDSLYNGLISANLPLFTGGVIHANVRTALSELRQAHLDESLTRRQVEQDVRLAHSNLQAAADRTRELLVSRDAAQEALRQAEESYNAGLATNLERLVAQDQLLSAELELATVTYEQKLFYLNLQRVIGQIARVIQTAAASDDGAPPATAPAAAAEPTSEPTASLSD